MKSHQVISHIFSSPNPTGKANKMSMSNNNTPSLCSSSSSNFIISTPCKQFLFLGLPFACLLAFLSHNHIILLIYITNYFHCHFHHSTRTLVHNQKVAFKFFIQSNKTQNWFLTYFLPFNLSLFHSFMFIIVEEFSKQDLISTCEPK